MTAGMGVRKNVHIEDWVAKRENLEMYFKFTKGAWARFAVFGIAVPYAAYQAIVYEMVRPRQRALRDLLQGRTVRFFASLVVSSLTSASSVVCSSSAYP
jgi:hypothetical protein